MCENGTTISLKPILVSWAELWKIEMAEMRDRVDSSDSESSECQLDDEGGEDNTVGSRSL